MIAPLFDELIGKVRSMTAAALPIPLGAWPDAGRANLVLRGEMAFELGAGRLHAVSLFAAAPDEAVPEGDLAFLLGPDLPDIRADRPWARVALVRLRPTAWQEEASLYAALTRVRDARYAVNPRGYMPRVDSDRDREPVRVSREALRAGLTFSHAAGAYNAAYRRFPETAGVTQIFVTAPDFDYSALQALSRSCSQVVSALDHILKDFKMDCDTCKLQAVCSEVEGLRELHFKR